MGTSASAWWPPYSRSSSAIGAAASGSGLRAHVGGTPVRKARLLSFLSMLVAHESVSLTALSKLTARGQLQEGFGEYVPARAQVYRPGARPFITTMFSTETPVCMSLLILHAIRKPVTTYSRTPDAHEVRARAPALQDGALCALQLLALQ